MNSGVWLFCAVALWAITTIWREIRLERRHRAKMRELRFNQRFNHVIRDNPDPIKLS